MCEKCELEAGKKCLRHSSSSRPSCGKCCRTATAKPRHDRCAEESTTSKQHHHWCCSGRHIPSEILEHKPSCQHHADRSPPCSNAHICQHALHHTVNNSILLRERAFKAHQTIPTRCVKGGGPRGLLLSTTAALKIAVGHGAPILPGELDAFSFTFRAPKVQPAQDCMASRPFQHHLSSFLKSVAAVLQPDRWTGPPSVCESPACRSVCQDNAESGFVMTICLQC